MPWFKLVLLQYFLIDLFWGEKICEIKSSSEPLKIPWWIDCEKGDLILHGLLGIMITHSREAYQPTSISWDGIGVFWMAQVCLLTSGRHTCLQQLGKGLDNFFRFVGQPWCSPCDDCVNLCHCCWRDNSFIPEPKLKVEKWMLRCFKKAMELGKEFTIHWNLDDKPVYLIYFWLLATYKPMS